MYLCVIMKKVLFEFLDLKYSGKSIVMHSYSNDDASCQIYVVEDTNDSIMHISDFGCFTEFTCVAGEEPHCPSHGSAKACAY